MIPWRFRPVPAGGRLVAVAVILALAAFLVLDRPDPGSPAGVDSPVLLTGNTMGTRYRISLPAGVLDDIPTREGLHRQVRQRLDYLDKALFSTWTPQSELSRFNRSEINVPVHLSPEILQVIALAGEVNRVSGGAFDATVKPLVDLWGFGPEGLPMHVPERATVNAMLARVGMDALVLDAEQGALMKTRIVDLDLSGIAKGFAVDDIAALLEARGVSDYLVEIGGEMISRGYRDGDLVPWRLGIEAPDDAAPVLFQALTTGGEKTAMAGSGSYRNFLDIEGRRYAHIIDPRDGRPVAHDLVSAVVVADTAARADALATAMMVLGAEEGMKLANQLQLAAFFITSNDQGYQTHHSEAFSDYLKPPVQQ